MAQPVAKKALVRNTRKPTPWTKVRRDANQEIAIIPKLNLRDHTEKSDNARKSKSKSKAPAAPARAVEHDLRVPEVNSSKNMRQKLLELKENIPKKSEARTDSQVTINELITKSVNFPQDRTVFKNLIPLNAKLMKDTEQLAPQRGDANSPADTDVEPDFGKFTKSRRMREFSYDAKAVSRNRSLIRTYKGSKHFLSHASNSN